MSPVIDHPKTKGFVKSAVEPTALTRPSAADPYGGLSIFTDQPDNIT